MPRISQPSSSRLVLGISVTALMFSMLVGGFGYFALSRIDDNALTRQTSFVVKGLTEHLEIVPKEQESVTVWDDAVRAVRSNDQSFMSENLGRWMGEYFGHDEIFILDDSDRPVHEMVDGATLSSDQFKPVSREWSYLVGELRSRIAAALTEEDPAGAIRKLGVDDFMMLGGLPAIVSVKPIVPSADDRLQEVGKAFLHVTVQRLDNKIRSDLSKTYSLDKLHFSPSRIDDWRTASAPITAANGKAIGFLVWERNRPGLRLALEMAPLLGTGSLVTLILLAFLLRRLSRTTRELQVSEAHAQYQASHDALTGLSNRLMFEERLEQALGHARKTNGRVGLLFMDLDRFKNINDTLGHACGDELIRQVALLLTEVCPSTSLVARLGGDEFAIIQPEVQDLRDGEDLAGAIVAAFARVFILDGKEIYTSVSIGVTVSQFTETDRSELLRQADIALYDAKAKGRGRYQLFNGELDKIVQRRQILEDDLRTALRLGDQLFVVYQPLYSIEGTRIIGAEALVRWTHPTEGLLSPDLFIGIAEERGLIGKLGEWVLKEACLLASRIDVPWIAVNVSPIQIREEGYADRVAEIISSAGIPMRKIQLEITEGALLEDSAAVEATLKKLRVLGISVALDDFGTGHSSITYLRRFNVDKLKIDRSFVQQLGHSEDADTLVRAMVILARALRIQVTAEGVETQQQREILAEMGCNELQGFLMSRPVDASRFAKLLSESALVRSSA